MAKKSLEKPNGKSATAGIKTRLSDKQEDLTYKPDKTERITRSYINRRVSEMQDFRRNLGIEKRWTEADEEYIPHEMDFGTTRKRFETDQDTGLRSRMVPVGDATQQWRSNASAPTLLAKIQTAISVMVDQMPEAELVALQKKYTHTTDLAYALWKRNWSVTNAKDKLKLLIFNCIKYGWAPQRTYPRTVKYPKRVLVEKDTVNPENDRYEEKELTWFNDVDREPLDPFRTWIDELAKPYDQFSTNESYFEVDYPYDQFKAEFGQYPNSKFVKRNSQVIRNDQTRKQGRKSTKDETKMRQDVVTVGFFESRFKDLYAIKAVKDNIIVYLSPLPNDDGYISVTHTLWLLRAFNLPYGISLWEILRQNKQLYDKMNNMTMDQLVLSIMKFGFYAGTNAALGDGSIAIVPGAARQLTSSTGKPEINWMDIPGPGAEAWKGLEAIQAMMDDDTGISPTMEGEITGKTLGEIMQAKESSMRKLKVPLDNIAWGIEQDAYLTLSWMSQIYSIPTVIDFDTMQDVLQYEKETGMDHMENGLIGQLQEDGTTSGPFQAHYLPQLSLHLEDKDGQMFEGKSSKFFQVGKDIKPGDMKWRGIFKVKTASIIGESPTLQKAAKMELFNVLIPILGQPPQLAAKAASEIVKAHDEDTQDWLPDAWNRYLDDPNAPEFAPQPAPTPQEGTPTNGQTMQGNQGMSQQEAPTVVPKGQISAPTQQQTGLGNIFIKKT